VIPFDPGGDAISSTDPVGHRPDATFLGQLLNGLMVLLTGLPFLLLAGMAWREHSDTI
jgi:hypothetical protein